MTQSGKPTISMGAAGGYAREISVPRGMFTIVKPPSGRCVTFEPNCGPAVAIWRLMDTTSNETSVGGACARRVTDATVSSTGATTWRIFTIDASVKNLSIDAEERELAVSA